MHQRGYQNPHCSKGMLHLGRGKEDNQLLGAADVLQWFFCFLSQSPSFASHHLHLALDRVLHEGMALMSTFNPKCDNRGGGTKTMVRKGQWSSVGDKALQVVEVLDLHTEPSEVNGCLSCSEGLRGCMCGEVMGALKGAPKTLPFSIYRLF